MTSSKKSHAQSEQTIQSKHKATTKSNFNALFNALEFESISATFEVCPELARVQFVLYDPGNQGLLNATIAMTGDDIFNLSQVVYSMIACRDFEFKSALVSRYGSYDSDKMELDYRCADSVGWTIAHSIDREFYALNLYLPPQKPQEWWQSNLDNIFANLAKEYEAARDFIVARPQMFKDAELAGGAK